MLEFAERGHAIVNAIEQDQNRDAGVERPQPRPMSRLLIRPGRTEIGARGHFHDGNLISAVDHLRNVDFFEVVSQAIVKRFQAIDLAFDAVELGQPLTQIERFGSPTP